MNPHVLVPRVFGLGWTINFGAVAVSWGLVRPDDEDVPFGQVPRSWLSAALVLPLSLAAAFAVLVAVFQPGLPGQVATHWGANGIADGFSAKGLALLLPTGMTIFGVVVALRTWVLGRPPFSRAASGALATSLASMSVGVYGQSVAQSRGVEGVAIVMWALVAALVLPFVLLVVLSRAGRAAEQRRDLGGTSKKGSV